MDALWLAILIYSLGLAVVLQLRPRLMFHENGSWKEFGYQRDSRHTLFPFWLFAISWAFVSYAAAAAASWVFTAGAAGAAVAMSPAAALSALEFDGENVRAAPPPSMFDGEPDADTDVDADTGDRNSGSDNMSYATPVSRMSRNSNSGSSGGRRNPRAGYYVLDPASQKSGLRRYIFYGTNRP